MKVTRFELLVVRFLIEILVSRPEPMDKELVDDAREWLAQIKGWT